MELTNFIREGDLAAVQKWLEDNPDPSKDSVTSGGVSIAHWAASGENTDILRLILSKLPNLTNDQSYEDGATPLHWAAQDNREKNISLLLSKGAEMLTDHMGETPLHLAAMNGFLNCAQLLCSPAVVNVASSEGNTPLHLATMNANKRIVAFLLSQGADADAQNKKKETPRGLAAAKKDKELLDYFDPEKLLLLEEIAKVREEVEEMHGKNADMKNAMEAEAMKKTAALTALKVAEDKASALTTTCATLERQLIDANQLIQQKDTTIAVLQEQLRLANLNAATLERDLADASTAASAPRPNGPRSHHDFPSELVYSNVRHSQEELQRLSKVLEQTNSAIITAKTALNQLEESLGTN